MKDFSNYNVKDLIKSTTGESLVDSISLTAKQASELTKLIFDEDIIVNICISSIQNGVIVEASVKYSVKHPCSKCNTIVHQRCESSTDDEYLQNIEIASDDQHLIDRNLCINLTQQIVDTIVLAYPVLVLCKKNCSGLCVTCGININNDPDHYHKYPKHKVVINLDNHPKIV